MSPIITFWRASFTLLILGFFCHCNTSSQQNLKIACASNAVIPLEEIVRAFNDETGISCDLIPASSGMLCAQIREGAPYDVFLSADFQYPELLHAQGYAIKAPEVYAFGKLVLCANPRLEMDFSSLNLQLINHFAIANPKTAPYGAAALASLKYFDVFNSLQDKLVFGENINQTAQFLHSGAAEAGLIAKSMALSGTFMEKLKCTDIDPASYPPIAQSVVMINQNSKDQSHAQIFYNFLFSESSRRIFEKYGYSLPERP